MKTFQKSLLRVSACLQAAIGLAAALPPGLQPQAAQWAYDPGPESPAVSGNLADPSGPSGFSAGHSEPIGSPGLGKQILGGMAYGAGGLLIGGATGAGVFSLACRLWGEDCGFAGLGGALVGGVFGFAGAFPLGVYRFGSDESVNGSWQWTYASALLGAAVGFGGWALISGLEDEDHWFQAALLGMAGAPTGALIGFNATRETRKGIPEISFSPHRGGGWAGHLTWHLGSR
jgi:hypothetical protein